MAMCVEIDRCATRKANSEMSSAQPAAARGDRSGRKRCEINRARIAPRGGRPGVRHTRLLAAGLPYLAFCMGPSAIATPRSITSCRQEEKGARPGTV